MIDDNHAILLLKKYTYISALLNYNYIQVKIKCLHSGLPHHLFLYINLFIYKIIYNLLHF